MIARPLSGPPQQLSHLRLLRKIVSQYHRQPLKRCRACAAAIPFSLSNYSACTWKRLEQPLSRLKLLLVPLKNRLTRTGILHGKAEAEVRATVAITERSGDERSKKGQLNQAPRGSGCNQGVMLV